MKSEKFRFIYARASPVCRHSLSDCILRSFADSAGKEDIIKALISGKRHEREKKCLLTQDCVLRPCSQGLTVYQQIMRGLDF